MKKILIVIIALTMTNAGNKYLCQNAMDTISINTNKMKVYTDNNNVRMFSHHLTEYRLAKVDLKVHCSGLIDASGLIKTSDAWVNEMIETLNKKTK